MLCYMDKRHSLSPLPLWERGAELDLVTLKLQVRGLHHGIPLTQICTEFVSAARIPLPQGERGRRRVASTSELQIFASHDQTRRKTHQSRSRKRTRAAGEGDRRKRQVLSSGRRTQDLGR